MITETLSREELVKLIQSTPHNCFMSVKFIKKDGSERKLTGLRGVKKHLHGGKLTVNPDKFFIFWDKDIKDYRAVNKETIFEVRVNKKCYIIR